MLPVCDEATTPEGNAGRPLYSDGQSGGQCRQRRLRVRCPCILGEASERRESQAGTSGLTQGEEGRRDIQDRELGERIERIDIFDIFAVCEWMNDARGQVADAYVRADEVQRFIAVGHCG